MSTPVPRTPSAWRVLLLMWILIVLLNVFDALSTLEVIRRGGEEANPIAQPLFLFGHSVFFFWKVGLTALCAAALALLARTRRAAWWLLWLAVAVYTGVACLHVYLLWFFKHPS